jgi:hypothetical protein
MLFLDYSIRLKTPQVKSTLQQFPAASALICNLTPENIVPGPSVFTPWYPDVTFDNIGLKQDVNEPNGTFIFPAGLYHIQARHCVREAETDTHWSFQLNPPDNDSKYGTTGVGQSTTGPVAGDNRDAIWDGYWLSDGITAFAQSIAFITTLGQILSSQVYATRVVGANNGIPIGGLV